MSGHGRRRAHRRRCTSVITPVVASVCLLAALAAIAGCAGAKYRSLEAGQCLPASAQVEGERQADPPRVGCGVAHRYEVYKVASIGIDGRWPGQDAVDAAAKQVCYANFGAVVGTEPADLPDGLTQVVIGPTESSWNDQADRDVECLLRFSDDRVGTFIADTHA